MGQPLVALGHTPRLTNRTVTAAHPLSSTIQFDSDGLLQAGSGTATPEWCGYYVNTGISVGGSYEIRCTVVSGSSSNVSGASAHATWLPMTDGQFWGYDTVASGSWLVEIRSAVTQQVLTSATYTISKTA